MVEKEWSKKFEVTHKDYELLLQKKEKELQLKDEIINQKEAELAKKDLLKREEIVSLINQIKELEIKLEAKIEDVISIYLLFIFIYFINTSSLECGYIFYRKRNCRIY